VQRDIRTFKNHFIASLCTTGKDFGGEITDFLSHFLRKSKKKSPSKIKTGKQQNNLISSASQKFVLRHCHLPYLHCHLCESMDSEEVNAHKIVDEEDTFVSSISL
jgi:hypothetical protein